MPVLIPETKADKIEVMLWLGGQGPLTPAVHRRIERNGITFGAALITRSYSDGYTKN